MHTLQTASHKTEQHHRTPSRAARPTFQQTRLLMELALEADVAMEQAAMMDAVDVRHTTTVYPRQHRSRFGRLAMLLVSKRREKVLARRAYNKVS
jgi:hypothetical protein